MDLMGGTPIRGVKGCKRGCNGISLITLVGYSTINIMNAIEIKVVYVRILTGSDLVWSYLSGALDFLLWLGRMVVECLGDSVVLSPSEDNPMMVPANFGGL